MSAYAIVPSPVVIDSTFVPDLVVTGAGASTGPSTRKADRTANAELVDLEPHWLAAADAATD